jgi:hypothetical protein
MVWFLEKLVGILLLLEVVFEYRKIIKEDPYPEIYIEQKERNV